jgi:lambda family phage portal protein
MGLKQKILQAMGGVEKSVVNKRVIVRSNGNPPRRNFKAPLKKTQNLRNESSIAAGAVTRLTSDWLGITRSINADIRAGLVRIRARARQAAMEDPYAKKFLRMLERNVVGPDGFIMRGKVQKEVRDKETGRIRFEKERDINRLIESKFKKWSNKKFATVLGNVSFRRACQLIVKCTARDGEIFIIERRDTNKFGYSLQLVESDYCDETFNSVLSNGNVVVMGVEIDKQRRVQAYWFRTPRLETEAMGGIYGGKRTRVEASKVIHVFVKESPFQLRGISWFAPMLVRLKMLNAYEEASLIAARVAASQTIALEKKDNYGGPGPNKANIAGGTEDSSGNIVQPIAPGEAWLAPDGYKVINYTPTSPNDKQANFTEHNLRGIATGGDVSFINLANNYSQVNYTSSRTNLLEERDSFEDLHAWCKEDFLDDISSHWFEMACISGELPREWLLNLDYYDKIEFKGRVWPWVDPEKTANANIKENLNNMKTLQEIFDEKGLDWEEELEQLAAENEFLVKRKLRREVQQVVVVGDVPSPEDDEKENGNGKAKHYAAFQN